MLKKELESIIKTVLEAEKIPHGNLTVEVSEHGDYATNFALRLGKFASYQSPIEIAKFLVAKLPNVPLISSVEIAPPGFINFHINQKEAANFLTKVIDDADRYGSSKMNLNKAARVEFVSANPTGPLHLGNARGGPIGDVLANVLKATGFEVTSEYYDNNIGTQVDIFGDSLVVMIKRKLGLEVGEGEKVAYEGSYLVELADKMIADLSLKDSDQLDREKEEIKHKGIQTLFEEIIADCRSMGISFDEIYHESEIQKELTAKVIAEIKSKGLTKEKDGALWFAPNDEFLEDKEAVIERSDSRRPTYFADDIAYHQIKFEGKPDLVFNVLGSNHHAHVARVLAAIKAIGGDPSKYQAILYQYVRVKRGNEIVKMSKRAGNFITAREIIDEVGADAFRFFLLMHAPKTHMDFDLELAKEKSSENPVFYAQYAHARMSSLLAKAGELEEGANLELLTTPEEFALVKKILQFPDVIEAISQNFAVHQLTFFALELAELFHKFYEAHQVISEDSEITQARVYLVKATQITLANTLKLLGVSTPEKM